MVNDGDLDEVHESGRRIIANQVRQGVLADQLGFNYWFMTEHHFQPEGRRTLTGPAADRNRAIAALDIANPPRPDGQHPALVAPDSLWPSPRQCST